MKSLLILRHAKSSWKEDSLPDIERPLNKRGKETAPQMGELIHREGLVPDLIISSAAQRARLTAELAAEAMGYDGQIEVDRELYGGGPSAYLRALSKVDNFFDRVMIVGHNPDVEDLIKGLTHQYQPMPTAALAWVELPIETWKALDIQQHGRVAWTETPVEAWDTSMVMTHGRLAGLWRPKEID
jgi:phosphohistidine phosphatase